MDLIIGGGTYGKLAFDRIKDGGRSVVVIDEDPGCIVQMNYSLPEVSAVDELPEKAVFIRGGPETAARIVAGRLNETKESGHEKRTTGRIFPTAPVHVLAGIISEICGFVPDPEGAKTAAGLIPEELIAGKKEADIYCTYNNEKPCHPRCPSPVVCPVTGEKRDTPLGKNLENSLREKGNPQKHFPVVIESKQLGPGLGYIDCRDLLGAIERACKKDSILAVTACTCHGVVTALKKE